MDEERAKGAFLGEGAGSKAGQRGAPRTWDSRAEKKRRAAQVTGVSGEGAQAGEVNQPIAGAGPGGGHGERSLRAPWKLRGAGEASLPPDSARGPRQGRRPTASRVAEGRRGMSEAGLRSERRPRRAALPGASKNLPVPHRSEAARGSRARGGPSRASPHRGWEASSGQLEGPSGSPGEH